MKECIKLTNNKKVPTWFPKNIVATTGGCSVLKIHFAGIASSSDEQAWEVAGRDECYWQRQSSLSYLHWTWGWERGVGVTFQFILKVSPIWNYLHTINMPKLSNLKKYFTLWVTPGRAAIPPKTAICVWAMLYHPVQKVIRKLLN